MGDNNIISKISDVEKEAKWNIVDVHGDDGLLHRGCIVGVAPGGLAIDFGSEIREVVCGKVYRSRQQTFFREHDNRPTSQYRGTLVEVLLRVGPDKPFKWYPGTLLFGDSTKDHAFGLVRVYLSDRTDCLAVPGNRFRTASTEAGLKKSVFGEGQLVDRTSVSEIPDRQRSFTMEDDWGQIAFHRGQLVRTVHYNVNELNQKVLRCDTRWLVVTDIGKGVLYVKNALASSPVRKSRQSHTGGLWQRLQGCTRFGGFLAGEIFRASCVLLETYLKIDVYDGTEISFRCLSRNVLSEIVACLDSIDQVRIRAVCTEWHSELTSAQRVVRYTYGRNEDQTFRGEYELAECLIKCWNDDTQVIAIGGNGKLPMSKIGQYIQDIMREKQRTPVNTLLLYNQHMENHRKAEPADFVEDLRTTLSPLAAVCSTLILKDISMFRPSRIIPIVLHFKHARITASQLEDDQRVNLWERLNKSCPRLEESDSSTLAAWIRNFTDVERMEVYRNYRPTDRDNIAKILTFIQGNDPREGIHYRFQTWQPDQVATLDLGKLTTLTIYALHAILHHDSMRIGVCW